MTISLEAADALESAIDRKIENAAPKRTRAAATVTRRDSDGTVYVRLEGAETETPVSGTAAAVKPGDVVGVTVDDGRLTIDGNYSAPATDDTAARAAQRTADSAAASAATAASAASDAVSSAAVAAEAAAEAQDSLKSVVQGATTVEKAVSVMQTALEAVVDYDPTNDTVTEYFWHDANGAHVLGDTSGYRNDITSSGMDIKQVSTEDSVASFGAGGWQVGLDDESHMVGDYHSLQLIDKEGNTYFHVSDLRDNTTGTATITDTFIGDGTTKVFQLTLAADSITSAVDSSNPGNTGTYDSSVRRYTFASAPADGASVTIVYKTSSVEAKAYSLSIRGSGRIGAMSVAEGYRPVASGQYSHAEGENCEASGKGSHAEGDSTTASAMWAHAEGQSTVASAHRAHAEGSATVASGQVAHAEGSHTEASGKHSHAEGYHTIASASGAHAQGDHTIANGQYQTVLGSYNIADNLSTVIIGNGTESARSNSLTMDRWGNIDLATPLKRASGGTGITNIGYFNTTNNGSDYTAPAASTWYQACSFTIPQGCGILFARLALSTGSTAGYSYVYLTSSTLDAVKADPPNYQTTSLGLRIICGTGTNEHKDVTIAVPYNIAQNTTYYLHWKSISTSTVYRTGTIRYLKLGESY